MDETAPREEEMVITSSESLETVLDALNEKQDVFIAHDDFYNEFEKDLHINLNSNNLTKVFIIKEHDPVKQLERISELPFEAYYLKKQLFATSLGIIAMIIVSRIPYRFWMRVSGLAYLMAFGLCTAVIFIGTEAKGQARWIYIGPLSFQPSEFAKLAVIIYQIATTHMFNFVGK